MFPVSNQRPRSIAQREPRGVLRSMRGFTLLELMVVVVIVGVLAGIALPSYQESMRKARRNDAKEALMEVASRQEQLMLDRSRYTADMTELGYGADPMVSKESLYNVDRIAATLAGGTNCAVNDVTCYVLRARPIATEAQAADTRCTDFFLDSTGAKTASGTHNDTCW